MKRPMKRQQSGFTLVEIAIVLVIIGLLLGGVLKGQELINSARAKAVINDFRNTATMVAAYQDRFRALPGDDPAAAARLAGAVNATTGGVIGNGLIDGAWNSVTPTDESVMIWHQLRLANLASGDQASPIAAALIADWLPRNTENGRVGVQSAQPIAGVVWAGRLFVCQGNISGRIAQQVDITMDEGQPGLGSVRFGTPAAAGPAFVPVVIGGAAPTFNENALYTICASF